MLTSAERTASLLTAEQRLRSILENKGMRNVKFRMEPVEELPPNAKSRKFELIVDHTHARNCGQETDSVNPVSFQGKVLPYRILDFRLRRSTGPGPEAVTRQIEHDLVVYEEAVLPIHPLVGKWEHGLRPFLQTDLSVLPPLSI